jgi:hypothetical protein
MACSTPLTRVGVLTFADPSVVWTPSNRARRALAFDARRIELGQSLGTTHGVQPCSLRAARVARKLPLPDRA